MIVIDSSIFMALAQTEPGSYAYVAPIRRARTRVMSAGNYLECGILARTRLGGADVLDGWVRDEAIRIVPVDLGLAQIAADAFARYGKGRHPAGLNFGDCFAYALARSLGAPLLYKGDDFARTDIPSALPA